MPITVNTTDTFEQWRLKTNNIGEAIETNVSSVYSSVYSALSANIAAVNSNIASNVSTINSSIASNVSTINSSIASNAASVSSTINSSINSNVATINSNITSNVNTKLSLSGGTMTGAITTPNGAVGINIGDDARLSDRNAANTLFLEGIQNNDRGYVNFSTTAGNELGSLNGGALTWRGATVLHSSNYNSFAPTLTGTGASGTWNINVTWNNVTSKPILATYNGYYDTGYLGDGANGDRTYDIDYPSVGTPTASIPLVEVDFDYWVYFGGGDYPCAVTLKSVGWYVSYPPAGTTVLRIIMNINGSGQTWPYNFRFKIYS